VAAAFFLAAFAAISISRVTETSDLVWPGNALAAALLVRLPRVRWLPALIGVVLGGVLANWLSVHEPLRYSMAMSCVNGLEIATTSWIFRNCLTYPLPNISFHQGLRMAGVFAFAVPFLTALPGGWLVHSEFGEPWTAAALEWWLSGAIGACLCAPAVYLYSTKTARRLISRAFLAENLTLAAFCIVSTYLAVRYVGFPFIVIAVPLTVAAFRAGSFGAAVLSGVCGSLVIALWSFGVRPGRGRGEGL